MADAAPVLVGKRQGGDTRFKPGQSGNPAGRPLGFKTPQTLLNEAIAAAIKLRAKLKEPCSCVVALPGDDLDTLWDRSCKTIDEHYARQAFHDSAILNSFQKKRLPDLQHQTGDSKPSVVMIRMGGDPPANGNGHASGS